MDGDDTITIEGNDAEKIYVRNQCLEGAEEVLVRRDSDLISPTS